MQAKSHPAQTTVNGIINRDTPAKVTTEKAEGNYPDSRMPGTNGFLPSILIHTACGSSIDISRVNEILGLSKWGLAYNGRAAMRRIIHRGSELMPGASYFDIVWR